jgi:hypothetical protein
MDLHCREVLTCVFRALLLPCVLSALSPQTFAAAARSDFVSLPFTSETGFCPDGVFGSTRWPDGERPDGIVAWTSYCGGKGADTGSAESSAFLAPASLSIYIAGYLGSPNLRLRLIQVESGQQMELLPKSLPAEKWEPATFTIAPDWVGKRVRMVAEDQATGTRGWFGFTEPVLPRSSVAGGYIDVGSTQAGFCSNGVYHTTVWPGDGRPGGITWGSYCKSGNDDTGRKASKPVTAGTYLSVYLAGYPGFPNVRAAVENIQSGVQLPLQVSGLPRETWQRYNFPLPAEWKGQSIRVIAEDKAKGPFGWLGFTEPLPEPSLTSQVFLATRMIGAIFVFLIALLLPGMACAVLAAMRGTKDPVDLTTLALLGDALFGYAAFWVYFVSHPAGIAYSYVTLLVSCAVIAIGLQRRKVKWPLLRQLFEPWGLVALASVFVLSLGLLHGGEERPLVLAAGRFGPPTLAADNELPKVLADDVFRGHIPKPMIGDWLSSDRPPLQAGFDLWKYWMWGKYDYFYLIESTILQCLFFAGLWVYLMAANVGRPATALVLFVALFSGFTILNSFYTWPKLLPVTFLLILAGYLLTGRYHGVHNRWTSGLGAGAAAAFALLGHGGSAFALIGIGITLIILRRYPGRRFLLAAVCAAGAVYLPWVLYQKYYDPPGDRLLKWHLAGTIPPRPDVGLGELLVKNYGDLTVRDLVQNKISNFRTLVDGVSYFKQDLAVACKHTFDRQLMARGAAVGALRASMFHGWVLCVGVAVFGPVALLLCWVCRRRYSPELSSAQTLWLCIAVTMTVWCVAMFGPDQTTVHQGSYFTEVAAFAGTVLAFWAFSPAAAVVLGVVSVFLNTMLYVWLGPTPPAGFVDTLGPINSALWLTCFLSAMVFLAWLWLLARAGTSSRA